MGWGFASVESEATWSWSLQRMKLAYPSIDRAGVTLMSDRQKVSTLIISVACIRQNTDATKGLIVAVSRELPLFTHGHLSRGHGRVVWQGVRNACKCTARVYNIAYKEKERSYQQEDFRGAAFRGGLR